MQVMSPCHATLRKSCHRSLHVAIPNVAGDLSWATCHLSRLIEHQQRNKCVANNVIVAVVCRVSRITEHSFIRVAVREGGEDENGPGVGRKNGQGGRMAGGRK